MSRTVDVALGVRLAVGGGRTLKNSLLRLVLTTVGIGITTALLLLVVTAASALSDRSDRIAARAPDPAGSSATATYLVQSRPTGDIRVTYLEAGGPGAPVPPGLKALPGPGELVVSPALAARMDADPTVRGLFDQRVVGTIDQSGLAQPDELWAYSGASGLKGARDVTEAHGFGGGQGSLPTSLLVLGAFGLLVLVVPMLVFVATSSRVGGAERERRLSALRLAGAGVKQVRRIAAAEALVGAVSGAVIGLLGYLAVRPFAAEVSVAGVRVFPAEFVPAWLPTLLVFVLIPLLTVGSAWLGLRGLIIEPLAVLRRGKPVRRRGWWRLVLVVAGVVLMFPDKLFGVADKPANTTPFVFAGAALLMIGVPVLLPWLTENAVGRLRGGTPAWQLAVRRLQLDSGTPSRVVAGLVVVLTAVISLQTVLASVQAQSQDEQAGTVPAGTVDLTVDPSVADDVVATVASVPGVRTTSAVRSFDFTTPQGHRSLIAGSCAYLEHEYQLPGCTDGDTFVLGQGLVGQTLDVSSLDGENGDQAPGGSFTVPANARQAAMRTDGRHVSADVLVTSGAAAGLPGVVTEGTAYVDPSADALVTANIRAALAKYEWRATAWPGDELLVLDHSGDETVAAIGAILSVGAVLTMLLGGVSMLVMVVGQVSERRRPLAAMSAAGVPPGVLGRSLLWQNAIPLAFGVVVAVGAGIAISALMLRMIAEGAVMRFDLPFTLVMAGVTVLLVLVVTGAALPGLRAATKLEAVRME